MQGRFDYGFVLQSAFPKHENTPSFRLEGSNLPGVPLNIGRELGLPELGPGGRTSCAGASEMPVPETAMDEDGEPVLRKHEVRPSGQVFRVEAEAQAHAVRDASNADFRCRVPASDLRHIGATARRVELINQGQPIREVPVTISLPA